MGAFIKRKRDSGINYHTAICLLSGQCISTDLQSVFYSSNLQSYVAGHALQTNLRERNFPDRKVRRRVPPEDLDEHQRAIRALHQRAIAQQGVNPVSFGLTNEWHDTITADKKHHLEHFTKRYDMIPSSPLFRITFTLSVSTPPPPSSFSHFCFTPHCPSHSIWLFVSSTMWWELTYISIWSFRHFYLRLLSIPVCLSKDVTGALVCSRGHSSSSFIIVRFIMRYMPGSHLFRSLHQLVATFGVVCECQLRHNRSGSMRSLYTSV